MCLVKDSVSDLPRLCGEDHEAGEIETVLGIQNDTNLNFENQRLEALQRISNLLKAQKKNLLFNSIIKSKLRYCPLVCMVCS